MHTTELETLGYAVLPGYLPTERLNALRARVDELLAAEGDRAGEEFRQEAGAQRLANLVDKGRVFEEMLLMPEVLSLVRAVLGPECKLSSLNMRSANPHSTEAQPLHADMGLLPDERGNAVCNCVWMLDDFTSTNGALRLVPGSHRFGRLPARDEIHPEEQLVTGTAGTVVVMNAHAWHGGTANRTDRRRRALHSFFCRSDVPQQQYQKRLLRPETQAALSPGLRTLLALDDPQNDELCARVTSVSGFLR